MMKKSLFILIVLLMLTACGGAKMSAPEAMPAEEMFFDEEQSAAGSATSDYYGEEATNSAGLSVEAAPIERLVIKNAELAIITIDPAQSMDEIGKMAENMEGFVVSSNLVRRVCLDEETPALDGPFKVLGPIRHAALECKIEQHILCRILRPHLGSSGLFHTADCEAHWT